MTSTSSLPELNNIIIQLKTLLEIYRQIEDYQPYLSSPNIESILRTHIDLLESTLQTSLPFKLLLLGGTGVGKSTLINTFAQAKITSTSHSIRAHTSYFCLYVHKRWKHILHTQSKTINTFWNSDLLPLSRFIYHDHKELESIWLIDAPDIDSIAHEHHQRVRFALSQSDLPIWMTSPEKYRDISNVDVLSLIDYRRPILAVINQIDRVSHRDRSLLLSDAQEFLKGLHFQSVTWFMTSCISSEQDHQFGEFKTYIYQHLNQQEIERIRSLHIAQRLNETYIHLLEPVEKQRQYLQMQEWITNAKTTLNPLIRQQINILFYEGISHRYYTQQVSRAPYQPIDRIQRVKIWLQSGSNIAWWFVNNVYSTSNIQQEERRQNIRLQLRVLELKIKRSRPNIDQIPEISYETTLLKLIDNTLHRAHFFELQSSSNLHLNHTLLLPLSCLVCCLIMLCIHSLLRDSFLSWVGYSFLTFIFSLLAVGYRLFHRFNTLSFILCESHQKTLTQMSDRALELWITPMLFAVKTDHSQNELNKAAKGQLMMKRYEEYLHYFRKNFYAIFDR